MCNSWQSCNSGDGGCEDGSVGGAEDSGKGGEWSGKADKYTDGQINKLWGL